MPGNHEFEGLGGFPRPPAPPPPRQPIISKVTATKLSDLNTEEELLVQYKAAKDLFDELSGDNTVPANQKASVLTAITSVLSKILENQTKLYDSERVKLIEGTLINTLKAFPDLSGPFMKAYENALAEADRA
jgi:hypothetical protein